MKISCLFFNNSKLSFKSRAYQLWRHLNISSITLHKCSLNASIATFHHLKLASRLSPVIVASWWRHNLCDRKDRRKSRAPSSYHGDRELKSFTLWLMVDKPSLATYKVSWADWCVVNAVLLFFFIICRLLLLALQFANAKLQLKSLHKMCDWLFPWEFFHIIFLKYMWKTFVQNLTITFS